MRGGSYYAEVLRKIHDIKLDKLHENIKPVTDNEDNFEKGYKLFVTEENASVFEINDNSYVSDPGEQDGGSGDIDSGPDSEKSWEEISTDL